MDRDSLDRATIAPVGQHDIVAAVPPILALLAQREDHRQQGFALLAERIDHLAAIIRIGRALENAARNHLAQTVGQDVARGPTPFRTCNIAPAMAT